MQRLSIPLFLIIGCLSTSCAARIYTPAGVEVASAPPAVRYEAVPVSPGPTYVWVHGHWGWNGGRYHWVRGRYLHRPASHYVWRQPVWVPHRGRYRYVPGGWVVRGHVRGRVEARPHRHIGRR